MSDLGLHAVLPAAPAGWPTAGQGAATLDRRTLRDLGGRFAELAGQPVSRWLEEAPLVPRLDQRAELQDFDRIIAAELWALEAVCARPRSHLSYQIDRVPAARVRRAPPRALAHLSAHTEDWEGTTLLGVKPRRLLAEQREETLDLYENRVAARLVDHLERYLGGRQRELTQVLGMVDEFQRAQEEAAQGSHWRQGRLFKLFAGSIEADPLRESARRTQAALQGLWRRVGALKATELYRAIPARAQVGATLRMTNVLSNDPLYLRVARLYLEWQREAPEPTEEERRAEQAQAAAGFRGFGQLVVLRALQQLGWQPEESAQAVGPGRALRLVGPGAGSLLRIDVAERGVELTLLDARAEAGDAPSVPAREKDRLTVEVLPLALLGTAKEDAAALAGALAGLRAGALVLHLGVREPPALPRALQEVLLGLDGAPGARGRLAPVSPWDLGSVERVARLLRGWLLAPRLLAYPPRVAAVPPEVRPLVAGRRWLRVDREGAALLRSPNGDGVRSELARLHEGLRAEQTRAEEKQRLAQEDRDASKDDRRALGDANWRKAQAARERSEVQARCRAVGAFVDSLRQAEEELEQLRRCPVCNREGGSLEARDQDTFHCGCDGGEGCGSTYETRVCACGERIAVLWPRLDWRRAADRVGAGAGPSDGPADWPVDWIDRLFGCDVLALPCPHQHDDPVPLCPRCGACAACGPGGA